MPGLSIHLLGRLDISLEGQPVKFRSRKATALLIYLLTEGVFHLKGTVQREALQTLLWPDFLERSARQNLRTALSFLRKALPEIETENGEERAPFLLSDNQFVQINPAVVYDFDASTFTGLLKDIENHEHKELMKCARCHEWLEQATALYRGDFLTDFYLPDSGQFETWAAGRREEFRRNALGALAKLTTIHMAYAEFDKAETVARRQLEIDNLLESAHRELMEILVRMGRRRAALTHYETVCQLLKDNLGIEPSVETQNLYKAIVEEEIDKDPGLQQAGLGIDHSVTTSFPGDYQIKELIGEGGYGSVYTAIQTSIGREVAIKIIRPEFANQPDFVRRFETEAQIVAQLEHPHIVPVYDYWRDEDGAFLVMRLLPSRSLKEVLLEESLDVSRVIRIAEQIAGALVTAHRQGVIHRDLKPSNILLDGQDNAYLNDFGIAKDLRAEEKYTPSDAIIGTPDYISPEQIQNQPLTPAADQYSLAIVIFQALTGRLPFAGNNFNVLFQQHLHAPMPAVTTYRPDLPPDIDYVLQRAGSKDPARRYPDAISFAAALREALDTALRTPADEVQPPLLWPPFLIGDADLKREKPLFVGREPEIEWLEEQLASVFHDAQTGRVVFISGEAGSGKTTLLREFVHRAHEGSARPLISWGNCLTYAGRGDPYMPFRELLGILAGDLEAAWASRALPTDQAKRIWQALSANARIILDHGPSLMDVFVSSRDLRIKAAQIAPGAPWLSRLERGESTPVSSNPQQSQLFSQYASVINQMAKSRPLLLILDDLHWIDQASADLLFHLSRKVSESPVLIVGAYRPEEIGRESQEQQHPLARLLNDSKRLFGDIVLSLDETEGRVFVDAILDSEPNDLDEAFRQAIHDQTEGHPLFTVELLRHMEEQGYLIRDEQGRLSQGDGFPWKSLPARIEGIIEERLGRLDAELAETLSFASVEGEVFTVQALARLKGTTERTIARQLSQQLAHGYRLVEEHGRLLFEDTQLHRYRFKHSLFHQHLYESLSEMERTLLHRDLGRVLEELYAADLGPHYGDLGFHAEQAGEGSLAAEWYLRAAEWVGAQSALFEAKRFYERSIACMPSTPTGERWAAHYGLYRAAEFLGDMDSCREVLPELLRLAEALGRPEFMAKTYFAGGSYAQSMGEDRKALAQLEKALDIASSNGDEQLAAAVLGLQSVSLTRLGEMEAALKAGRLALDKAEALDDSLELKRNLNNLATYYVTMGDYSLAAGLFARQVSLCRETEDQVGEVHGLLNLAYAQLQLGQYSLALETAERTRSLAVELGAERLGAYNHLHLCLAHWRLGQAGQAQEHVITARRFFEAAGDSFGRGVSYTYLGLILESTGEAQEALEAFATAHRSLEEIEAAPFAADALAGKARCALRIGDNKRATSFAESLAGYLNRDGAGGLEFPVLAYKSCADVFAAVGKTEEAGRLKKAAYDELIARAEQISDVEERHSYLENIGEHKAIVTTSY